MSRPVRAVFFGTLLILLVAAPIVLFSGSGPSEAELATRVKAAHPDWPDYQEDMKGQVGAGPVAEWVGEPVAAYQDGKDVVVRFRLTGPWVKRDLSLPILLRDPVLKVYRHASAARHGDITDYRFHVSDQDERVLPWVEVKYPHHTRRLTLTAPPKKRSGP